jgi:hypothetical protein
MVVNTHSREEIGFGEEIQECGRDGPGHADAIWDAEEFLVLGV